MIWTKAVACSFPAPRLKVLRRISSAGSVPAVAIANYQNHFFSSTAATDSDKPHDAGKVHAEITLNRSQIGNTLDSARRLKHLYTKIDRDQDGVISLREFQLFISRLRLPAMTQSQVEDMFRQTDTDGSGVIELPEFMGLLQKVATLATASSPVYVGERLSPIVQLSDRISKLFDSIDTSGDGQIDKSETLSYMKELGFSDLTMSDINDAFDDADVDNSGDINVGEMAAFLVGVSGVATDLLNYQTGLTQELSFRELNTADEILQAKRLLHDVYVGEAGWEFVPGNPTGLRVEEVDGIPHVEDEIENCILIGGVDDTTDKVHFCARLVFPDLEGLLDINRYESDHQQEINDMVKASSSATANGDLVEFQRLASTKECRSYGYFLAMERFWFEFMYKKGVDKLVYSQMQAFPPMRYPGIEKIGSMTYNPGEGPVDIYKIHGIQSSFGRMRGTWA